MCSIGGVVNFDMDSAVVRSFVLDLLPPMADRGMDAAGIAAYKSPGEVWIRKNPEPSPMFAEKLAEVEGWEKARIILLHARAATHCSPSNNYCNHPLVYYSRKCGRLLALVHNGVVDGPKELQARARFGVDSELILLAIAEEYEDRCKLDAETVRLAVLDISGRMAIIVTDGEDVVAYRRDNPLAMLWSSGLLAFVSCPYMFADAADHLKNGYKVYALERETFIHINLPTRRVLRSGAWRQVGVHTPCSY